MRVGNVFGHVCVSVCPSVQAITFELLHIALADPRGAPGTPPGVQILLFSCSFWQNFEK